MFSLPKHCRDPLTLFNRCIGGILLGLILTSQIALVYASTGTSLTFEANVIGAQEQDKTVTVTIQLLTLDAEVMAARHAYMRITSEIGTFRDLYVYPVDENGIPLGNGELGTHLSGSFTLSKYAKSGVWQTSQIVISDNLGNEHFVAVNDSDWTLTIDNPLEDLTLPQYVKNTATLTTSISTVGGQEVQVIHTSWQVDESTGMRESSACYVQLTDDIQHTYRTEEYGQYDSVNHLCQVDIIMPHYMASTTYTLTTMIMIDQALNSQNIDFSNEPPYQITLLTNNPDYEAPELDLNALHIESQPSNPEAPDGETLVTITYQVRDNNSGLRFGALRLRDPLGASHFYYAYNSGGYDLFPSDDPTEWHTYTRQIILPVNSPPGTWVMYEMWLLDRAKNTITNDLGELLTFDVPDANAELINQAPVISGNPNTEVTEGDSYSFTPSTSDADDDALTFSLTNKPTWAQFNSVTGALTGTPSAENVGTTFNIVINVSDGNDSASLPAFDLTVTAIVIENQAPVISGNPNTEVTEGDSYSFTPSTSDADDDGLTFSLTNKPTWAQFNSATGALTGTPSADDVGTTLDIVINVSDGNDSASLPAFDLTVTAIVIENQAPVAHGAELNTLVEQILNGQLNASDPDNDLLAFSLVSGSSFGQIVLNESSGVFTYTPNQNISGEDSFTFKVNDGDLDSNVALVTVTIIGDTQAPWIVERPLITEVTKTSAVIEWQTNEITDGKVKLNDNVNFIDDEMGTSHRVVVTGLSAATNYQVEVVSVDAAGNGPAEAITQFTTLESSDTEPPHILSGPIVVGISNKQATLMWTTSEPASSGVQYDDGEQELESNDNTLTVEHSIVLSELIPETLYFAGVFSSDGSGNGPTISNRISFTTLREPDNEVPLFIGAPLIVNVTHQSAIIRWQTDEPADSLIQFGESSETMDLDEIRVALTSQHNLTMTGLQADTRYFFQVSSTDAAGNTAVYPEVLKFNTKVLGQQTAPLIIEEPTVERITDRSISVSWQTDTATDSWLDCTDGSAKKRLASGNSQVKKHLLTLVGLTPSETYQCQVISSNPAGHQKISAVLMAKNSFSGSKLVSKNATEEITTAAEPDLFAPEFLVMPSAIESNENSLVIGWENDELSSALVKYQEVGEEDILHTGLLEQSKAHRIILVGLKALTQYEIWVTSQDDMGNQRVSESLLAMTAFSHSQQALEFVLSPRVEKDELGYWLKWSSNRLSFSQLQYGFSVEKMTNAVANEAPSYEHQILLAHLDNNRDYFGQVEVTDITGEKLQSASFTIINHGKAEFSLGSYSVAEDANQLTLVVNRVDGSDGDLVVNYEIKEGSAKAGKDFTANSGELIFSRNELYKQISIVIINNSIVDSDRFFEVDLSGGNLGSTSNIKVTIINEDTAAVSPPVKSESSGGGGGSAGLWMILLGVLNIGLRRFLLCKPVS